MSDVHDYIIELDTDEYGRVLTNVHGTEIVEVLEPGPRGVQGPVGPQGIQGIQGVKGDKGDKGDTGAQGPIGPQGVQGAQGPVGPTGLNWRGVWSSTIDYLEDDAVSYNGASWFATNNPPTGAVPSTSSTYWSPLALQGATGAQGPTGPQGPIGPTGPQGPKGDKGDPGTGSVSTVNGDAGPDVVLDKADIGLANVANVDTTNAANIATGTLPDGRLPARLQGQPTPVTDFNLATTNGFYSATNTATNAPATGAWWFIQVIAYSSGTTNLIQRANKMGTTEWYERYRDNTGVWGAWYRTALTNAEAEARYQKLLRVGPSTIKRSEALGFYQDAASIPGDLVIRTTLSFSNRMTAVRLTGYAYAAQSSVIDLAVNFYSYASGSPLVYSFPNISVVNYGDFPITRVRLGRDDTTGGVVIIVTSGLASQHWHYPKVYGEVMTTHSTAADSEVTGWTASITTDFTGISILTDPAVDRALLSRGNLAGLSAPGTARVNLGLGDAAVRSVGTTGSTVAAGDDPRIAGTLVTDWNNATTPGWAWGPSNTPNAPGTGYWIGRVEAYGPASNDVSQTLHNWGGSGTDTRAWRRHRVGGTWGAWYRLQLGQGEQDARYAALAHTHTKSQITDFAHTHAITDLTATGTRDATTYLRGDGTWSVPPAPTASSIVNIQVFTASGTWTKPANVTEVEVLVVGGGGSGGNGGASTASAAIYRPGSGGGGGGAGTGVFAATDLPATVSVSIGAGGAPTQPAVVNTGSSVGGANGSNGSPSSFGTYVSARGGGGGVGGQSTGEQLGGAGIQGGGSGGTYSTTTGSVSAGGAGITGGGGSGGTANSTNSGRGSAGGHGIGGTPGAADQGTSGVRPGLAATSPTASAPGGGGGGGAGVTGSPASLLNGSNGGNGVYGGGGGGGGAVHNSSTTAGAQAQAGAGGNGGNGLVVVVSR